MSDNKEVLIAKYLSGNASPEESRELMAWIAENSENERIFRDSESMWNISASLRKHKEPDVEAAWAEFSAITEPSKTGIRRLGQFVKPLRVAAAIAFLATTIFLVQFVNTENNDTQLLQPQQIALNNEEFIQENYPAVVETPDTFTVIEPVARPKPAVKRKKSVPITMIAISSEDSAMMFELPDKSKVYMNRNSKLTYPEVFKHDNRVVHLSGEAYFEIEPGTDPFFVFCRETKSKAMGAAFNVSGYDNREIEISVVQGLVEISKVKPTETRIIIGKGNKVTYDGENEQFVQTKVTKKEKWWKRANFRKMIKNFFNRIIHGNNNN